MIKRFESYLKKLSLPVEFPFFLFSWQTSKWVNCNWSHIWTATTSEKSQVRCHLQGKGKRERKNKFDQESNLSAHSFAQWTKHNDNKLLLLRRYTVRGYYFLDWSSPSFILLPVRIYYSKNIYNEIYNQSFKN